MLHALTTSSSLTWSFCLYLAKNTSHEAPHSAVFSNLTSLHLFGPNILLNTLFSNTLSLCSSLNVTEQVSHLYKTACRKHCDCIYNGTRQAKYSLRKAWIKSFCFVVK
jgi:hypothetical protein